MTHLIGVHGINNQQSGRHQLECDWRPALADGLERAAGFRVTPPSLDIAFYGDLFLPSALGRKGASTIDLDDDDADDLAEHVLEATATASLAELTALIPQSKGFCPVPSGIQLLLRALDAAFGSRALSALFLGQLKQVRRYLLDSDLKTIADARVKDTAGPRPDAVIGHSLGSVVALEFLRLNPHIRVPVLITLGSPLGLKTIRALLPEPDWAHGTIPPNVGRWVNIRDGRDPVSCAGDLSQTWTGIADMPPVHNGNDPHSAVRYLSKAATGRALLEAHPQLAEPHQGESKDQPDAR